MSEARRVVIELTDRCNLACRHCFSGRHGGKRDIPFDIVRSVLDQAKPLGFSEIAYTGGEAALHPRFADIIACTAEAGFRFGIVSNGWNFPRHAELLLRYRDRLGGMTFSVDGAREHTHDRQRGVGSYRTVMRAISVCAALDIPFALNMVITAWNVAEIVELPTIAARLGARGVRFGHLMHTPRTTELGMDLSPEERLRAEDEIRGIQRSAAIPVVAAPGVFTRDLAPCAPLRMNEVNVDCGGNLTMCCHLSGHGEAAGAADVSGNLAVIGFAEGVAVLHGRNRLLLERKRELDDRGELGQSGHFPCWYCVRALGKAEWLRGAAGPWSRELGGTSSEPDRQTETASRCGCDRASERRGRSAAPGHATILQLEPYRGSGMDTVGRE